MLTNMTPMRCGGCGSDEFKLFTEDETKRIAVECQGCKDVSLLTTSSKLEIEWGEPSNGVLCKW